MQTDGRVNVTISLPHRVWLQEQHQAAAAGLSLPAYIAHVLEAHTDEGARCRQAEARQLALMSSGMNLGFERTGWSREQTHDR